MDGHSGIDEPLIALESLRIAPFTANSSDLVCVLALVRHGDRTCKQKIQLKFHGKCPPEFPTNEDIRTSEMIALMRMYLSGDLRTSCKSEPSSIQNAISILSSDKDDLKLKIEPMVHTVGWVLKLKWGGTLTPLGISQSRECGREFSSFIPPSSSSVPVDIKAYSSTDTRCKETAAFFVDGLKEVYGYRSSIPIRSEDGPDGLGSLEDVPFRHSPRVERLRSEISALLMNGSAISEELKDDLFPSEDYHDTELPGRTTLDSIASQYKSFSRAVSDLKVIIDEFVSQLSHMCATDSTHKLFLNETIGLAHARWCHIAKNFQKSYGTGVRSASASPRSRWKSVEGGRTQSGALFSSVQISLIGEIHDNSQYDFRHNFSHFSPALATHLERIRTLSNLLAQVVTPCEHGLSLLDRTYIGASFLRPLLQKFRFDCRLSTGYPLGEEAVYVSKHDETINDTATCRVRLYFAHHSHLISLINLVRSLKTHFCSFAKFNIIDGIDLLGYTSRVVLRIYKHADEYTLVIAISKGDDFTSRDAVSFSTIDVLEAHFPNRDHLDDFFTKWLSLAIPESSLGPIGESTSENLE